MIMCGYSNQLNHSNHDSYTAYDYYDYSNQSNHLNHDSPIPSAFAIMMILIAMLVIMLFLINILIAQLTTTYDSAKQNARLEFDISKALFVTRIENSRFKCLVSNPRHG